MKTVHLLRHAKSAWNDPSLPDHDRPLAPRGARAATLIGRHLRSQGFKADAILCSTARRAADTLDLVLAQLDGTLPPVEHERGLYLAGDRVLLERLRKLPDGVRSVLLVAHNPDLQNLALSLVGAGDASEIQGLASKYPTGALATLTFPVDHWSEIGPQGGTLTQFVVPKKLT
jgi:phosphohistidine phosphatase